MVLVSLELGGLLNNPRMPFMRWGSHISIIAILVTMFVIPHDQSTRMRPDQVGSDALQLGWHTMRPRGPAAPTPVAPLPAPGAPGQPGAPRASLHHQGRARARLARGRAREPLGVLAFVAEERRAPANLTALLLHSKWRHSRTLASLRRSFRAPSARGTSARGGAAAAGGGAGAVAVGGTNGSYVFTTVEALRRQHGQRRHWFGDLDARETRRLYHELLPRQLLDGEESVYEEHGLPVEERARLAVAARRAARLYARERAHLPVALSCEIVDGVRTLMAQGSFQPGGLSEEQIFAKYAAKLGEGGGDVEQVYRMMLLKSCASNAHVDRLMGV
ncbi:hypothetical protein EMIHUDRAFT_420881 [Emiliania huxleyi CCMP1516]|uniref:Uncharacterized protein n=2 Tax=Emiliania huxleyi TaxID=2903 RepID=A0A0D3KM96_EMIH1|nr:hypothetical protein EMIHUDRAFT_420881 [Emiliania huxleyi CCMP1516]EOD36881.1 hypothetical protein EMIHUDRAFT_420881 [Emiliania huxleyi CCMP1516]|eukprot:XP_005789310.1 hypothetical protein EMIHUDRAFT_420881 [Emiliania huxleyi CCMP1516]